MSDTLRLFSLLAGTGKASGRVGAIRANMIQGTATCSGVSQDGTSIRPESFKERLSRIRERRPSRNMPAWRGVTECAGKRSFMS